MTTNATDVATAMTGPAPALLEVDDLRVHYPILRGLIRQRQAGTVRAVDGVSLSVNRGETVGLVGESGSGKTTLGRAVLRLVRPTSGRIKIDGHDITALGRDDDRNLRRDVQMVFQNPYNSLNPRMTIGNIIADPLRVHGVGDEASRRDRVQDLLKLVGIRPDLVNRYPHQFSGGQRQRIGLARALVLEPSLIVCDEPVSALDVSIQAQILNLLTELQARLGPAFLLISHDLAVVRHVSSRVAVMYLGRLVEVASRDQLYAAPLHPYSVALIASVHLPDPNIERRRVRVALKGEVPSASAPPPGCRFHTRCWLYGQLGQPEDCTTIEPELREVVPGQAVACHFAERVPAQRAFLTSAAPGAPRESLASVPLGRAESARPK